MGLPVVVGSRVATIYLPTDAPAETRLGSVTVIGVGRGWNGSFIVQLDDIGDGGYQIVCHSSEQGVLWELGEDLLTRASLVAAHVLSESAR